MYKTAVSRCTNMAIVCRKGEKAILINFRLITGVFLSQYCPLVALFFFNSKGKTLANGKAVDFVVVTFSDMYLKRNFLNMYRLFTFRE